MMGSYYYYDTEEVPQLHLHDCMWSGECYSSHTTLFTCSNSPQQQNTLVPPQPQLAPQNQQLNQHQSSLSQLYQPCHTIVNCDLLPTNQIIMNNRNLSGASSNSSNSSSGNSTTSISLSSVNSCNVLGGVDVVDQLDVVTTQSNNKIENDQNCKITQYNESHVKVIEKKRSKGEKSIPNKRSGQWVSSSATRRTNNNHKSIKNTTIAIVNNNSSLDNKKLRHREVEKNRHRQLQAMVKTLSDQIPGKLDKETQVQTMKRAARYCIFLRDIVNLLLSRHDLKRPGDLKEKIENIYIKSCNRVDSIS